MSSLRLPRAAEVPWAILVAALSSCISSSGLGPLWHPMAGALQCTPVPGAKVLTEGLEPIQNRATATAVIDTVGLARAKGVRVITAYLVPTPDRSTE